jgi:epoxide hydrolase 4
MTQPIAHHQIEINGIQLHVAEALPTDGTKDAPLALLLHGFPEYWGSWKSQIQALSAAGYRVWAPDLRGYGLSDKPPKVRDYRLKTLAEDVRQLVDAAGVEKCMLVAHDWGAAVAWWAAAEFPERFSRMVIANVPHPAVFERHIKWNPSQTRRSWYILFFQIPYLPERVLGARNFKRMEKEMAGSANPGSFTEEMLQGYRESWSHGGFRSMINYYRAAMRYQDMPRDKTIKVPTLILWGKKDHALGFDMAEESIPLCDDGELHFFEDATHWVQHDCPKEFNRRMLEFLERGIEASSD